jgi:phage I-like protein
MYEVLSLSENMNTEPRGKDGNQSVIELSEADQKACDALGITKEDYVKYNL